MYITNLKAILEILTLSYIFGWVWCYALFKNTLKTKNSPPSDVFVNLSGASIAICIYSWWVLGILGVGLIVLRWRQSLILIALLLEALLNWSGKLEFNMFWLISCSTAAGEAPWTFSYRLITAFSVSFTVFLIRPLPWLWTGKSSPTSSSVLWW